MREVARRVFAEEYSRSDLRIKEGDSQYAPSYVVTPTGARCNRLFVVGVLTEVEDIGQDESYYRARISDPTGSFLVYAGRYQPEAAQALSSMEPPEFVAVTGKTDLFEPEDGDPIPTLRPEAVAKVDREERDRWIVTTARRTIERLEGLDELPEDIEEHYHPSLNEYRDVVREALRSLLGDEEFQEDRSPGDGESESGEKGEKVPAGTPTEPPGEAPEPSAPEGEGPPEGEDGSAGEAEGDAEEHDLRDVF